MTTFTVSTGQEALIVGGIAFIAALVTLCIAVGWVQGSASVKAVPPWQRKPSTRSQPTKPAGAAEEDAAAAPAVPKPVRKVS